jgi:hypothetical protein
VIVLCVAFDDDGTTHYKTRTRIYKGERERERKSLRRGSLSLTSAGWLRENSRRRWPSHQHKKETKLGVYIASSASASRRPWREREDGTTFLLKFRFLFFLKFFE